MRCIHSDRGSEFLNEELAAVCDYFGVRMSATPAYTPNANGLNERGHSIVDRMMDKILTADSNIKPEVALGWAFTACNSLDNVNGISP